jgi:hypothetical protein
MSPPASSHLTGNGINSNWRKISFSPWFTMKLFYGRTAKKEGKNENTNSIYLLLFRIGINFEYYTI